MRAIAKETQANILREQFIPDHVFVYIRQGGVSFFDGRNTRVLSAGDSCIVRKNSLAKFAVADSAEGFDPVLFCFDEPFLRSFQTKYKPVVTRAKTEGAFVAIEGSELLQNFMASIKPYQTEVMQLDEAFEDLKYEELLIILLKTNPYIGGLLFDFAPPEKINLEAFMNRHFNFNVSMSRFAYLTGRSLSAFKRDFQEIFNDSPGRWLTRKRLQEAYFNINTEGKNPSNIYLQLGFESLSHFSVAFKKMFGHAPTAKQQ
ncbi:helix-turn-helix domain-containing protein [Mucilaginibacter pedocola]|uniref:HTH araC/xylS-type domain-containing protein n=1 Tax=Mucilaginibacter pedocola TaxID=1792845 RepID=A0A1S9PHN4_9SPHI|nr:AraC family transcriptional regulator [Mucilaginibacter pedocola]OOQ60463.1 hypothetical protein BC343_24515 [Mucilaginibacter pedocola]